MADTCLMTKPKATISAAGTPSKDGAGAGPDVDAEDQNARQQYGTDSSVYVV